MTILAVIQAPDARLRQVCAPVTTFDGALRKLADDMAMTRQQSRAFGLAAPQVGELIRLISLNPGHTIGFAFMVNPEIIRHGNNKTFGTEGCLSIDAGKTFFKVKRWDTITVRFQTIEGETKEVISRGFGARVVQHEIDHLNGKMIREGQP